MSWFLFDAFIFGSGYSTSRACQIANIIAIGQAGLLNSLIAIWQVLIGYTRHDRLTGEKGELVPGSGPAHPLGELGSCLGRQVKRGAKMPKKAKYDFRNKRKLARCTWVPNQSSPCNSFTDSIAFEANWIWLKFTGFPDCNSIIQRLILNCSL